MKKNLLPKFNSSDSASLAESRKSRLLTRSGQVVIEYVLLLVIVSSVGAFLIKSLVSRSPDDTGILVKKWNAILQVIANDNPEE